MMKPQTGVAILIVHGLDIAKIFLCTVLEDEAAGSDRYLNYLRNVGQTKIEIMPYSTSVLAKRKIR